MFWLIAIGASSFAGMVLLAIFSDVRRPDGRAQANAYSYSAIGHRAFVETLRRLDVPVTVSGHNTARLAGDVRLLIAAEPRSAEAVTRLLASLPEGATLLLVLPKRTGEPQAANPRWLESSQLIDESEVQAVLAAVTSGAEVLRKKRALAGVRATFGVAPSLSAAPQLMRSSRMHPIVASGQGILVGEVKVRSLRIWILSDPDVLANHAIHRGGNAVFAAGMVDALRPAGGRVVFDETIHGLTQEPSLWRQAFALPFLAATILVVAATGMLFWAASGRFGAPVPTDKAIQPGKAGLIDNTANLLRIGGHDLEVLDRYAKVVLRDVADRGHAPRGLSEEDRIAWADRVGEARGTRQSYRALRGNLNSLLGTGRRDPETLWRQARQLYAWKQEVLYGPGGDPDHQRKT